MPNWSALLTPLLIRFQIYPAAVKRRLIRLWMSDLDDLDRRVAVIRADRRFLVEAIRRRVLAKAENSEQPHA